MKRGILIDNTTLHSLASADVNSAILPLRAREICRIVEQLLLGDSVWVSDTVNPKTLAVTRDLYDIFANAGLAQSAGGGMFDIAMFSKAQLRKACESAGPYIFDTVRHLYFIREDLKPPPYHIRPIGAPALDFPNVAKLEYGSDEAAEFVDKILQQPGWGASASAALLNPDLYLWLKNLTLQLLDPSHPVYLENKYALSLAYQRTTSGFPIKKRGIFCFLLAGAWACYPDRRGSARDLEPDVTRIWTSARSNHCRCKQSRARFS